MDDLPGSCECACIPEGRLDPCVALLSVICVGMAAVALLRPPPADMAVPPPPALSGVDPNLATWSQLVLLPRIGEGLARRIVSYRETAAAEVIGGGSTRVFTCSADLARVRGIGPKTVARISPYLGFDGS